ncbi:putative G2/mitotic-specific cyclin-B2 [Hypsibius exemplaris]|uniref:G2/mitotic-specific cyclin-B2 n=1 Tax=Hypsibius exemplaris TaxID=2072580 RepID=A0A1W0X0I7_HYPEX|nr:putative G2/mitotic-specific cyclin-B2 [Hypsibius exemplaris]
MASLLNRLGNQSHLAATGTHKTTKYPVIPSLSGLAKASKEPEVTTDKDNAAKATHNKRIRVAQETVRTAGKENGLINLRRRPDDVKDIYADDISNEALVVAYVEHIYAYLRKREAVRVSASYMEGMSINTRMRSILMDWIVSVAYKFKMCQDSLFLAVDIIDRFLAIPELDATKDELQLIGVTSMFIASKFEEVYPPELDDFVFISDSACSRSQILETEMMITNALDFDFSRPHTSHFLRRVSKAASADTSEYSTAKYFAELTLLSIDFVAIAPSLTAAASLYLTLLMRRGISQAHWNAELRFYSGYEESEVKPVAGKLLELVRSTPRSKQQCIYKKYCSTKLQEVAVEAATTAEEIAHYFRH